MVEMVGLPAKRPEEWKTEMFVRFDDPKSESCGRVPGTLNYSTIRSPSRRHQHDDSLVGPHCNEPKKTIENLCNRDSADNEHEGLCKEETLRYQPQDRYKFLEGLHKKACTRQDDASCVAEDLRLGKECQGNARGHRIGKKCTSFVARDLCHKEEYHENTRDHQNEAKYTADLYDDQNIDCLGGHFFRKEECINPYREELLRSAKNCGPPSRTTSNAMGKTSMGAGAKPLYISHTLGRSRSSVRRSNADCPTQISRSRSGSLSSSRCFTPRLSGRHSSHPCPVRHESPTHCPSRLDDPVPNECLRSLSKGREILYRDHPLSYSKSSHSCNTTATPRRSSNGIKASLTRRITLIERYQRGLSLRKVPCRNKDLSLSRKVSNCGCSLARRALFASSGKDGAHIMCCEGYWREKSEEGLSPLRSPWRKVIQSTHYEDPRRLQSCHAQLPPKDLQRNNRQPETYYSDRRRKSSHSCSSPHTLNESFRYDDLSDDNDPTLNSGNSSQTTRGSVKYNSPQITRTPNLSMYGPHAWRSSERSRPSENDDETRELSSHDDSHAPKNFSWEENPRLGNESSRCTRPRLAEKDSSLANHDPHAPKNTSLQNEYLQRTKDSDRCTRHHFSAKDSSLHNDNPQTPKNFGLQNEYPQTSKDSVRCTGRCTRPRLSAKDVPLPHYGPQTSRNLWFKKETEESREMSDQIDDPHNARTSWRQNDLYEAREVCHPFSARQAFDARFDDPVSTTDSCWYKDHRRGNEDRKTMHDSWWHNLAPDPELDESSSFKESHKDSRHPDSGREKASKFDHQSDSWRETDPQTARQGTSTFTEFNSQRDSSWNNESDEVQKLTTYKDHPPVKPRRNLHHEHIAPIKLPCCRSQEDDSSIPVSSHCYNQPQLHEQSQPRESNVSRRVAARHPVTKQSCESRHYDLDHYISPSRPRKNK